MFCLDLKAFRENCLKMTQTEFAQLLGVRQDTISRWEKNPSQIPADALYTISMRTGVDMNQLFNYKKPLPTPLNVENTWRSAEIMKHSLVDYIKKYSSSYNDDEAHTNYKPSFYNLQQNVEEILRKPKVVFAGYSDSGKSTLINSLIGKEKMFTDWTPTTSIVVYIKHLRDRPSYIEDELWIFKKGKDNEIWDDNRLNDEKYCREWKIAGGNSELLTSYGTRHGDKYKSDEIGSAVLFVDSDILLNCDFIDIPGFTGGIVSDNETAQKAQLKADVLVYLSACIGFLEKDYDYLKGNLKNLRVLENKTDPAIPPFVNLFIVGTHAHTIDGGNATSLESIFDDKCNKFMESFTPKFWEDRSSQSGMTYSESDLRRRFFAYTTDIAELRLGFEENFKLTIELLPRLIKENAVLMVKEYCKNQGVIIDKDIEKYQGILNERESYENSLNVILKNEPIRKIESNAKKQDLLFEIQKRCKDSTTKFDEKYNYLLSESHIVDLIDRKKYKSKKEDMQQLASYLCSEIEDELKTVLENESKEFSDSVDKYIADFENQCKASMNFSASFNFTNFNAKRAFASGLAGAATFGGLAFWASSLGNLGAYILIAKGVSLLSAIGISVGGTAAAASAVASLGGPVVLGVTLAVVAALSVFGIFSAGWKKKVAKELNKAFNEQNALLKYHESIQTFWNDTTLAFNTASNTMENEWQNSIMDLQKILQNYDAESIDKSIKKGREVKCFFEEIMAIIS